jgi:hypothetical protein
MTEAPHTLDAGLNISLGGDHSAGTIPCFGHAKHLKTESTDVLLRPGLLTSRLLLATMASCFAPNPSLFIALQEPKNLAQGFNPEVYTQFGKRRIPEKLRSIA